MNCLGKLRIRKGCFGEGQSKKILRWKNKSLLQVVKTLNIVPRLPDRAGKEKMNSKIETYSGKFDDEIIALILSIQNEEAKIELSLQEQPDLLDIHRSYQQPGGEFWIALSDGRVVGTIGLMLKENHCAVLKKFFVKKEFRSQKMQKHLERF